MKRVIEVNGVSNLHLLFDELTSSSVSEEEKEETLKKVKIQLDRLERYMLAYNKCVNDNEEAPFWHDILANPTRYPTNRERAE